MQTLEELRAQIEALKDAAQTVKTLVPAVKAVVDGVKNLLSEVKAGTITLEEVQTLLTDLSAALEKIRTEAPPEA